MKKSSFWSKLSSIKLFTNKKYIVVILSLFVIFLILSPIFMKQYKNGIKRSSPPHSNFHLSDPAHNIDNYYATLSFDYRGYLGSRTYDNYHSEYFYLYKVKLAQGRIDYYGKLVVRDDGTIAMKEAEKEYYCIVEKDIQSYRGIVYDFDVLMFPTFIDYVKIYTTELKSLIGNFIFLITLIASIVVYILIVIYAHMQERKF